MTTDEAADFCAVTGDYRGQRLGDLAATDAGLLELDRLAQSGSSDGLEKAAATVLLTRRDLAFRLQEIFKAAVIRAKTEAGVLYGG